MTASLRSQDVRDAVGDVRRRALALRMQPDFGCLRRSLNIYYGDEVRMSRMCALLGTFVKPGDVAFDIGSHVGDRVAALSAIGARVVCLEPQPICADAIRTIYAGNPNVTVIEAACGDAPGSARLHLNSANPTVTTLSDAFVSAATGRRGWTEQVWDSDIDVPVVTLDALIADFGTPGFVKIDVEGFEDRVLAGLSASLQFLSFEFTTIQRDVGVRCLDRLSALGHYEFNVSLGETQAFEKSGPWWHATEMRDYIQRVPHDANSGDVYARRL